jgi:type II secretory pathway component PulF
MTISEWLHTWWALAYIGIPIVIFTVVGFIERRTEQRNNSKHNHPTNFER